MKKRLKKNIDVFKLILFISLFVMSFSTTIELYKNRHPKEYNLNKTKYKFYLEQHKGQHDYKEQSANEFPTSGYYLNIEKTNEECSTGTIDQNTDLSIKALISFSTVCNLYYDITPSLTITSNIASAVAVIKINNDVVASGTVPVTAGVRNGKNVTITVSEPEYYYTETNGTYNDYEETFVMTTEDTTKNITLNERPWITGTTSNSSNTTAATKTTTNWHAGYYLVEAWGGKGGAGDKTGGAAGYVYGVVYIDYNNTVYSTAGGNGSSTTNRPAGGANGGGHGGSSTSGTGVGGNRGGGGGYSAFAIGSASISQTNITNGTVKFIAGGGGGSSAKGGTFGTSSGGAGGAGGGMSSTVSSITAGKVFFGSNGTANGSTDTPGRGGSTSSGFGGTNAGAGLVLLGGGGDERGGGGGAGYAGGGGGSVSNLSASNPGGGGGGSSFIANGVTYSGLPSSVTNKLTSSNPSSTGGAIKIQWIGKNFP